MQSLRRLLDLVLPPRRTEALVRTATIEELGSLATVRLIETSVPPVTVLLPYRQPLVKALIIEAKYRDSAHAQGLLGTVLREYLELLQDERSVLDGAPLVIVPMPLAKKRQRSRSYNQVERICRAALSSSLPSARLGTDLLVRERETAPQTSLAREGRVRNVAGAFRATGTLEGRATYILVDDVMTTGATLSAAADALRAGGVSRLHLLALAH